MYEWWRKNKPMFSLVPAIIFWVTSVIFFVVGMSFDNPMLLFGTDVSMYIAIALSLAITFIQILGNDASDMDFIEKVVWLASYALGIATNVYGLMTVLQFTNHSLEVITSVSLGIIIEVSPERFLIRFLKSMRPIVRVKKKKSNPHHTAFPIPTPPKFSSENQEVFQRIMERKSNQGER
jgi:hypothetical protein